MKNLKELSYTELVNINAGSSPAYNLGAIIGFSLGAIYHGVISGDIFH